MRLALGIGIAALLALAAPAVATAATSDHIYGITTADPPHLVTFESNAPGVLTSDEQISGRPSGERVLGMDVSPRDGGLYVLTRDASSVGRLYQLDPATADLSLIGQLPGTALADTAYGVDFIPPSNLLRVVANTGLNIRVSPVNAQVITDANINNINHPADPLPSLAGIAFHNSDNDPLTMTAEYAYDCTNDDWGTVNTPNSGTWAKIADVALTSESCDQVQLDESPAGNMWAVHRVSGVPTFYAVNIATGVHTSQGALPVPLAAMAAAEPNLIGVEATEVSAAENAGAAQVTVVRRNPRGSASFKVATSDVTAKAGEDYSGVISITPITFAAGEVTKTVSVPLMDDSVDEGNETFDLTVSNPASSEGASKAANLKTTVSIVDDDPTPVEPPPPPPVPDRDGDGVADSTDNCPNVSNGDQADRDGDGLGTVCDPIEPVPPLVGTCANQRQGTAGEDSLLGTAEGDTLNGLGAADSLYGFAGADCLNGGPGDDWLVGGQGDDVIRGGSGADVLLGGAGNDTIVTGAGKSLTIDAGAGNDTVNAKNGKRETVVCGLGSDTVKADKRDKLKGCEKRKR